MISILSWNLERMGLDEGRKKYRRRLDCTLRFLSGLRPNVMLLQEAFTAKVLGKRNSAEVIARELGYSHCLYTPTGGMGSIYDTGLAILSRFAVKTVQVKALPHGGLWPLYGSIVCRTEVVHPSFGSIIFFNTHFPDGRGNESMIARTFQMLVLLRFFRKTTSLDDPVVIAGDLNSSPGDPAICFLSAVSDLCPNPLRDVFNGEWPPEPTCDMRLRPDQRERIDYMFVRSPSNGRGMRVESARTILYSSNNGVSPSDHAPILAHFSIGRPM
jgi:endonuclease/exonuclease/phosphatase family metal-dependent hydrolase